MTKFTPGPWVIFGEDEPVPGVPSIMIETDKKPGQDLRGICAVDCTMDDAGNFVLTGDDWANAHLIAAAPDLLEALEAMMQGNGDPIERVTKAAAAIAKAKGQGDD